MPPDHPHSKSYWHRTLLLESLAITVPVSIASMRCDARTRIVHRNRSAPVHSDGSYRADVADAAFTPPARQVVGRAAARVHVFPALLRLMRGRTPQGPRGCS